MTKFLTILLAFIAENAHAAEMLTEDARLIEAAGVPLPPKAMFIHGHKVIGFRFASSVPAEEVQKWYRAQLSDWALFEKEDSWILFDGAARRGHGRDRAPQPGHRQVGEDPSGMKFPG